MNWDLIFSIVCAVVSAICSIITLIATIIIARMQIKQSNRIEEFEKRQDERDEKRYWEGVRTSARKYISKYYEQRGLLPLCAIASMYNSSYHYDRKMYSEFLEHNLDTQNEIMKLSKFELEVKEQKNFFSICLNELEKCYKKTFPGENKDLFYDHGKYFENTLIYYGKNKMVEMPPVGEKEGFFKTIPYEFIDYITDMIFYHKNEQPISKICEKYNFAGTTDEKACYIATAVAKYTARYGGDKEKGNTNEYGAPGEWAGETLDTMEDMFLSTLFDIYTNLVLC